MTKKIYIIASIVGSLLVFSLLPLFNYKVDRWRILHSDYTHLYTGSNMCNKTFLKTKFLCETNNTYNTIFMGSSANGYIDDTRIGPKTYNMKYNFGLLAIHLHNLKVLLKNGVKIKNLWVGINDYIIWKEPKDYFNSFERHPYSSNLIENIKTYAFYLFKKPDMTDWYMFTNPYLQKSDLITNPHPYLDAKERYYEHQKHPQKWQEYMDNNHPILLHYDDTHYRIDSAILEIKELVNICKQNNINLTLFIYPSWYKEQLEYNQIKLNEFKRKLANITNYYNFHEFNNKSFNAKYWQDPMHFSYLYGNYIVDSIHKHQHLVTKKNIKNIIKKHSENIIKYLIKPRNKIFSFGGEQNLTPMHQIFSINNIILSNKMKPYKFKNNKATLSIELKNNGIISHLFYPNNKTTNYILQIEVTTTEKSIMYYFYKNSTLNDYNEHDSSHVTLKKGKNHIYLIIPNNFINNGFRFDFDKNRGKYKIKKIVLYE